MAYTINKTDGTILSTVSDGTVDTTTDLVLIGKNYSGYGEFQNENYVKLLENFASTTAPGSPIAGQVYRTARQGTPPLLESPLEFEANPHPSAEVDAAVLCPEVYPSLIVGLVIEGLQVAVKSYKFMFPQL